jgi:hypothetical protein
MEVQHNVVVERYPRTPETWAAHCAPCQWTGDVWKQRAYAKADAYWHGHPDHWPLSTDAAAAAFDLEQL